MEFCHYYSSVFLSVVRAIITLVTVVYFSVQHKMSAAALKPDYIVPHWGEGWESTSSLPLIEELTPGRSKTLLGSLLKYRHTHMCWQEFCPFFCRQYSDPCRRHQHVKLNERWILSVVLFSIGQQFLVLFVSRKEGKVVSFWQVHSSSTARGQRSKVRLTLTSRCH